MTDTICLHELFQHNVARNPSLIAVVDRDRTYSYAELDARATGIAQRLRELGVRRETLVAICLDRGFEQVASIVGVLKAGGAYVPLDPAYPDERLAFLVGDCGTRVVLTQSDCAARLPRTAALTRVDVASIAASEHAWVASGLDATPDSAAYVIYTSGSSGTPKGVVVEHRQVVRLLSATESQFSFRESDVWTAFHSFGFDFSVWELWGALAYGGKLVMVPREVAKDPHAFLNLLSRERVTVLNQTPSYFRQLARMDALHGAQNPLALRYIIFGGETLDPTTLRSWIERHREDRLQLINMYGITETTVHVTYRRLGRTDIEQAATENPIGEPIADLTVYLLDPEGKPVAEGEVGEIYVSGAGVARGYLNRPELNAERFVRDAFAPVERRMYRSGDLARRLPNGELSYRGRADAQLKIRGFRIEPGEIESCLRRCSGVSDSAVIASDRVDGDAALVAYCVPAERARADAESLAAVELTLTAAVTCSLPEHMRPASYVFVDHFPLTSHGKIDLRALHELSPLAPMQSELAARDLNDVERTLYELWQETLGRREVGPHEDFFQAGGTSLGAMQLLVAIHEKLGVELEMSVWSEHGTISEFARLVSHENGSYATAS